jgi:hypothetical protein
MKTSIAAIALLLAGLGAAGAVQAQQDATRMSSATVTSNVPPRSGEASTMTNGVPNALTSNPQPGELGIQSRMTVRRSVDGRREADTRLMGGPAPAPADAGGSPTAASATVR